MNLICRNFIRLLYGITIVLTVALDAPSQQVLVEAESFESRGGWKLDTQFIDEMGSPYLLAHGLGEPVAEATTTVTFPEAGKYRVYVRTKDWVARWKAEGAPGKFQLLVNGVALPETFGTRGAKWFWQDGGTVEIKDTSVTLTLRDLTGFDGRCDAILFTKSEKAPPNESAVLTEWRRQQLGLADDPIQRNGYDLVVVGGGYSGMGAAISAARAGCRVALIQNRSVLGGNGSSEVRVWAMGLIRRGKYPRIGEIIEEISDIASKSPGTYEEFQDQKKERIVRAEPNVDLFLNHHAFKVETEDNKIVAVHAFDTRTSEQKRFTGKLFVDCTGHATIGFLAGADWEMTPTGRMGMSNMWAWDESDQKIPFPETPWALDLKMADFPYPRDHHGQWFWESGFDKDPLKDAEGIRDWNLRAVYGAFNAMKNRDGAKNHKTAFLTWVAYVGGTRESRRLLGDVVLSKGDVISKREFKDGCVPSTWSVDLHYPKKQFAKKFPDNPFISIAVHDRRVDRTYGYPVPYRCFYSRNISNLFMAGRCISVTHEALGTTRVMKTCGMMGEVVGKAASLCKLHDCLPRDVFEQYWNEMDQLLNLPGKARRNSVNEAFTIPNDALPIANSRGMLAEDDPARSTGEAIAKSRTKPPWNPDFTQMLQPVPTESKFIDPDYYIWGASMVQDNNGQCHLFYSRWQKELGHNAWVTSSEIAHAVADQPLGPYKHMDVALPARGKDMWDGLCTHNPTVHRFGEKYYLYYMGNTGDGKLSSELNWVHRNNQRVGVAVADSPNGPWTRFDKPLIDVSSDENAPDALMTSNPTICRNGGKFVLVYKAVGKKGTAPAFGPVVHMVATSKSPTGPFDKHPNPIFTKKDDRFPGEDPFIWRSRDGKLWAILKDRHGAYSDNGRALVLFTSKDGIDWQLAEHPLVSKLQINWKASGMQKVQHLERPQLWFEYGNPVVLFCAADEEPSREHSFNVAIPLLER